METIIGVILAYLISLAANLRSDAISEKRRQKLDEKIKKEADALQAIKERKLLKEQLRLVGTEAARLTGKAGMTAAEEPLFMLLTDEVFQEDITKWLTAWWPQEKKEAEDVLTGQMVKALERGGVGDERIAEFKEKYFDRIEKVVFCDPVLTHWRLNLALSTAFERFYELEATIRDQGNKTRHEVREQHQETRQQVAELAAEGAQRQVERFSKEARRKAEQRYRELALESCDIIDLANLPEGDRHIAARQLELRRLYVPLRVRVEVAYGRELSEADLEEIEKLREQRRMRGIEGKRSRAEGDEEEDKKDRVPLGQRLDEVKRLVLWGDPGAGKTTLMRWLATAYLLRLKQDPAFKDIPDVKTLPDYDWLPIVVRCRDLGDACASGVLDDVLAETFRKAQMTAQETMVLQAVMREFLAGGRALLLVDGLDEIANVGDRARFCQQIERLHIAFPRAPMIVTSRIVGYREMGYRIGRGFEHAAVAEFSKEDKDQFARRWCAITELPERREKAAEELIHAIHSSDRIDRLAGNPMLLTTLALVKRKVGKLPERRADLYWEAVLVLLNWRAEVDEPIDHHEAIPQLEYAAYEMCERGAQRLREDEIIALFEKMREEYPNVRAVKKHEPGEFLRMLERRTGIIIEAGEVRHKGRLVPVFEFRHLTFQEYLGALALVDGRFPGRDKTKSLAAYIAPLAGQTEEYKGERGPETMVKDTWREVLRLCVACCGDDDVDEVLLAILNPLEGENPRQTTRARAVLAALCLADGPNVSDQVAHKVLRIFARQVKEDDGSGEIHTSVDTAVVEMVGSEWEKVLRLTLVDEFCSRESLDRSSPGGLLGIISAASAPKDDKGLQEWFENTVLTLHSDKNSESIDAALTIMHMSFEERLKQVIPGMVEGLLAMLGKDGPSAHAAAWALGWLANKEIWKPTKDETKKIISFVSHSSSDIEAVVFSFWVLEETKDSQAVDAIIARMDDTRGRVSREAIDALGKIGDKRAVEPLLAKLDEQNSYMREYAINALGKIGDKRAVEPLLVKLDDSNSYVRGAVIDALVEIGDKRAVEPLLAKLDDTNSYVRSAVISALVEIGDKSVVEPLLVKLDDTNSYVRSAAINLLGKIGDKRAIEPLLAKLDDTNSYVSNAVINALVEIGDKRAKKSLLAKLDEQNSYVRSAALGALAKMCEEKIDHRLLTRYFDGGWSWLDPQKPVDEERVKKASKELEMPEEDIRSRFERLAEKYRLKLRWRS